jgi:hypothetical protein
MGRLKRQMQLRELGIEPPRKIRTPEEEEQQRAAWAEHARIGRLVTLSPGVPDWFWMEDEKMREKVRVLVVMLRQAKEKSAWPAKGSASQADRTDKQRSHRDPFRAAYETFKTSGKPEDLIEFKRRMALFQQLVREEAARIGLEP